MIVALGPERPPVTIGRQPASDVALTWDDEVSRTHADIERIGDVWTLVDDGRSRNGSYVNGERVHGRRPLRDGDVIALGRTRHHVRRAEADRRRAAARRPGRARVAGAERRPAPRARRALPPVRDEPLRHAAVEPRAGRRAVRQRRDGEVPPPRAVRPVRARRPAAAPQARRARAAALEQGVVTPARAARARGATTPFAYAAGGRACGSVGGMGLTGNWDGRISRRTLLRTGGSATAAYAASSAAPRCRRTPRRSSPATRSASASRPATRRRTASCCGRGSPPSRARAAAACCRTAIFGLRYEVAADERFRRIVRRGAVGRAAARGAHRRTPSSPGCARTRLLVPVQVGPDGEPGRTDPHRARRRLDARADAVRVRVVPELHQRLLPRVRRPGPAGPRPRRAPRRLHLRGPGHRRPRRAPPRAGGRAVLAQRLPHAARAVPHRPEPAGGARRVPVADDVGRPRVQGQLRRPAISTPDSRSRRSPSGAPPPTSRTGSTRRWRARASRSARTCRCTGARTGARSRRSTCSTRASTAPTRSRSARRPSAIRSPATARARSTTTRTILGAEQREWLLDGARGRAADGWNVLANQVGFAPQDRPRATDGAASASTRGTATSPIGSGSSTSSRAATSRTWW